MDFEKGVSHLWKESELYGGRLSHWHENGCREYEGESGHICGFAHKPGYLRRNYGLVPQAGIEPATLRLEGECSIH